MMFKMEPKVHADRERELVVMNLHLPLDEGEGNMTVARLEPVAAEDCDEALEWVERMEAALDNFTSEVRLIQERMLAARSSVADQAAARGERGAGAAYGMEVDRG